jgi:4-aminobutyrate aminotransferase-like enzyme
MTWLAADGTWPVIWRRARGHQVWDVEGRRYTDLTAAFGVAASGHANEEVVRAGCRQLRILPHAMGDVHPHHQKARLARELSRITFERWTGGAATGKVVFGNSGFEAVELALKTALLATRRRGVIVFEGAYHGLGYGALNATHRDLFRKPFLPQLGLFGCFIPFPTVSSLAATKQRIDALARQEAIGAILVEPIQGRGGIRVPAAGFLRALRERCDAHELLLIADEIFTGFGRTGRWFACEHENVVPDLVCLGKALTGGYPLSACVGRAELMDRAWPESAGEALHTSTFIANPVGCAMALAQIEELSRQRLVERSAMMGEKLTRLLIEATAGFHGVRLEIRGRGLMQGIVVRNARGVPWPELALRAVRRMLSLGFILLPEGSRGEVIAITPPLTIPEAELRRATKALRAAIGYALRSRKEY